MVRKFYSKYLNFQFTLYKGDKRFVFDFIPLEGNNYGIAYIGDKEAIKVLKESDEWKSGIVFECSTENTELEDEDNNADNGNDEMIVMSDITTYQKGKNLLASAPYNVDVSELGSKVAVIAKGKEFGLVFPNLK